MNLPTFDALNARLNALNPRERRLVTILAVVLGSILFLIIPIGIESIVISKQSVVEDLRTALHSVQAARSDVKERRAKKDVIAARYQKRAPALAGYLEQTARAQKLEVSDSVDRPEVPHGKRYVERNTIIHLKKAGMLHIAKFLESLEKSGDAISVSRLNVRRRTGEPDSYDVEVGASAFDRSEKATTTTPGQEKRP